MEKQNYNFVNLIKLLNWVKIKFLIFYRVLHHWRFFFCIFNECNTENVTQQKIILKVYYLLSHYLLQSLSFKTNYQRNVILYYHRGISLGLLQKYLANWEMQWNMPMIGSSIQVYFLTELFAPFWLVMISKTLGFFLLRSARWRCW